MLGQKNNQMSQNNPIEVKPARLSRISWLIIAACFIWVFFIASTAMAADYSSRKNFRKLETYKVDLSELSDLSEPRLDWRNPEYDIAFEIPTSDWVEDIELFLNIHAEGPVNASAPVHIRFNQAAPIVIQPRGSSFDARIKLDTSHVKAYRNIVTVSFAKDAGCIEQSDGAFSIDMEDSILVVKATTPSRDYFLKEAKQILNSPLSAPKTIAIHATGENRFAHEALAAQGLALNMPNLPRFSIGKSRADAEIHIGTKTELAKLIHGSEFANREGPMIGVIGTAPLRLILTADNQTQLSDLVKKFAAKEMPPARRNFAYAGEFSWQTPFKTKLAALDGYKPIYELGNLRFDRGWGNSAQSIKFDVDNPLSAAGKAKLHFVKSPAVSDQSSVNVSLNGESLGKVPLSGKRSTASFNIPRGLLVGMDNILTINPELSPTNSGGGCYDKDTIAGFAVGANSYLDIDTENYAFEGDLTRLAASGYPFSSNAGSKTHVVFSTRTSKERAAALRTFAQLGKAYGSGWTEAEFYSLADAPKSAAHNTLYIGSKLGTDIPRALSVAVEGRLNTPKTVNTASLSAGQPISLMSVRAGTSPVGGIAALYDNPGNPKVLNGYITSVRSKSFTRAMDQIVQHDHWNGLQGSLARWDSSGVEMGKTAFKAGQSNAVSPSVDQGFEFPSIAMPEFSLPDMSTLKVNFSPVKNRISNSVNATRQILNDVWSGLLTVFAGIMDYVPTLPESPDLPESPAPVETNETVTQPEPVKTKLVVTPAPKPKAPTLLSTTKPALKIKPVSEQYDPGASLRGYSKVSDLSKTAQYVPAATLKENNTVSASDAAPSLTTRLLSRFNLSNGEDGQKANILLFVLAMILLMLLMSLARPVPRRD